ncbi:MAG TPA: flavin reductase family protein [Thermomicrobiales bacterium]|nr:flavin reductase family protein [Thermomicrobiales bacterium]
MTDERHIQRSGGGIVSRGGERSSARDIEPGDLTELMRGWRRRWTTGVAIATTKANDGALRGITLTAVLPLSLEPPMLAFAIAQDGEFRGILDGSGRCCVQILDRDHGFVSERFAGRAPLPDARFTGVPHEMIDDLPVIAGSLAWAAGEIDRMDPAGDHVLVIVRVTSASLGEDTDDPLLSYEGRYRGLEAS